MQNESLTDWKILPLTDEDIDAVLAIEEDSFPKPWSRNIFTKELMNPVSYSLAGWLTRDTDDQLAAYIFFWIVHGEAHILNLTVRRDFRSMGLSKRILGFSLNFMREKGVEDIFLEVRRSNEAAIALYESFGFRVFYERKKYYVDEDALVMGLTLSQWNG
ncbi:MAG: ribosomal protein S18-alanine N-acetyltransferase [Proteobacteria bacterium]|nr:ribosomal protein S18-alanine N-acetyltransferase [Pseudomonadota bacterium]